MSKYIIYWNEGEIDNKDNPFTVCVEQYNTINKTLLLVNKLKENNNANRIDVVFNKKFLIKNGIPVNNEIINKEKNGNYIYLK